MNLNSINGYKTYIVAAITIAYAVVEYWNGSVTQTEMVDMILAALGASAIRHGIQNSK